MDGKKGELGLKKRLVIVSIIISLLFVGAFLLAISWGSYAMSLGDVVQTLLGNGSRLQTTTIWDIRLPRVSVAKL